MRNTSVFVGKENNRVERVPSAPKTGRWKSKMTSLLEATRMKIREESRQ